MNELADIIIAKLEVKQQEWDDEFHNSVQDLYGKESSKEAFIMTEEEALIGELARLQTLLMIFENKEEYEKAAILLSKLNAVKTKLRNGKPKGPVSNDREIEWESKYGGILLNCGEFRGQYAYLRFHGLWPADRFRLQYAFGGEHLIIHPEQDRYIVP